MSFNQNGGLSLVLKLWHSFDACTLSIWGEHSWSEGFSPLFRSYQLHLDADT